MSAVAGFQCLLRTKDFDELAHAFRHWDACFQQLNRGPFLGELHLVQAGAVQLLWVKANRTLRARGCLKPGCYGFTAVTPANAGAIWRGHHLIPGQINVNRPGVTMDHLAVGPYESLLVLVDGAVLRQRAGLFAGLDVEERLRDAVALGVGRETAGALETDLRGLLARVAAEPALLADAGAIEAEVVRRVLALLPGAEPRPAGPPRVLQRFALARRVEEFMLAHLDCPLLTEDLCREANVSERTLRYVFRDVFNLSPLAYFKTLRLNAVRRALKAAWPTEAVHEIAERWGFEHTGNFASDYRRLFGERPSETLAGKHAV